MASIVNRMEDILTEAHNAARNAVEAEVARQPEDMRALDCGFAWVTVEGNSELARFCRRKVKEHDSGTLASSGHLRQYGGKGYPRGWQFWKPGDFNGQSIRIHRVGADAFCKVLAEFGVRADVGSRYD